MINEEAKNKEIILGLLDQYIKENPNPDVDGIPWEIERQKKSAFFSESWCTGGLTGGSCWGEPKQAVVPGEEADLTHLDSFLEKYCPDITYLQYKKIYASAKKISFSVTEYYGNHTEKEFLYIEFSKIAQCMAGMALDFDGMKNTLQIQMDQEMKNKLLETLAIKEAKKKPSGTKPGKKQK